MNMLSEDSAKKSNSIAYLTYGNQPLNIAT